MTHAILWTYLYYTTFKKLFEFKFTIYSVYLIAVQLIKKMLTPATQFLIALHVLTSGTYVFIVTDIP